MTETIAMCTIYNRQFSNVDVAATETLPNSDSNGKSYCDSFKGWASVSNWLFADPFTYYWRRCISLGLQLNWAITCCAVVQHCY